MERSVRRIVLVVCLTLGGALAAEPALAACEQRDPACEVKTVCVGLVGAGRAGGDVGAGADWFPRPPRPFVPRPRPPRPHP